MLIMGLRFAAATLLSSNQSQYIALIYYSSFHFIFHYPNKTPTDYSSFQLIFR